MYDYMDGEKMSFMSAFKNNPSGIGEIDEYDVIRALVSHRFREQLNLSDQMIDRMRKSELMSLPEGAMYEIVDKHFKLRMQGRLNREIFYLIEAQRPNIGSGIMPRPLNLESYVKYRVNIEHEYGERLTQRFIGLAIHFCHMYLESSGEQSKGEIPINKIRCKICEKEKEEKDFLPIYLKNKKYVCRSCDRLGIGHRFFRASFILLGIILFWILAVYLIYFH